MTAINLLTVAALSLGHAPLPIACDKPAERPTLVVLIVIDQFPAWVIPQMEKHFCPGGFRRLMNDGAWFEEAYYPQAATITGVGHATIATGGVPAGHGIVGNAWFDRATEREIYCVADESVRIIGGPAENEPKVSPRLLEATTFADENRIASGFRAKTVAISAKDRSAILLAGHTGKAIWYTQKTGLFLSSTYYYANRKLPLWAEQFNAGRPADRFLNQTWTPLLAPAAYNAPPDDRPFEIDFKGLGRTFPHVLGKGIKLGPDFYKALSVSPKGNELLLDAARAAIAGEQLGARGVTDILCVSLTSNDYVGHAFGPESIEYLDMTLQTDRQLERFFADLDATIGAGKWTVMLTSDHGSCASPEYLQASGFDVGRVDPSLILGAADRVLDDAYGSDDWLAPYNDPGVTFRPSVLRKHNISVVAAQRVAAAAVRRVPGVADVFASSQSSAGPTSGTVVSAAAAATMHPERGPDLVIVPKPYWYLSREMHQHAAMHGTPYPYDSHVPLFICGPGVRAGRIVRRVQVTDLAPTITNYLGASAPSASNGGMLTEVFRSDPDGDR